MRPALLALLLIGCAGAAERSLLEITPWDVPRGQVCAFSGGDFRLSAIVDSAAAIAAAEAAGNGDGALLLSVSVDSAGQRGRYRRIETTLPESDAAALEAALEPLIGGAPGAHRGGRLLIERTAGRVTGLAVGPSQACRPLVADAREAERALEDLYRLHGREASAEILLHVDTAGRVDEGQVVRGTSDPVLDAGILAAGRRAVFHPAQIDRLPVPVWVQMTFTVQVACPPGDTIRWQLPPGDPCRNPRARRPPG